MLHRFSFLSSSIWMILVSVHFLLVFNSASFSLLKAEIINWIRLLNLCFRVTTEQDQKSTKEIWIRIWISHVERVVDNLSPTFGLLVGRNGPIVDYCWPGISSSACLAGWASTLTCVPISYPFRHCHFHLLLYDYSHGFLCFHGNASNSRGSSTFHQKSQAKLIRRREWKREQGKYQNSQSI